jgi:hypothetical protein
VSKIPEYIGATLGRVNRWIAQHTCFHVWATVVSADRKRVYTKCAKCQAESAGWTLDLPAPRQTYPAVPGANGVISRSR